MKNVLPSVSHFIEHKYFSFAMVLVAFLYVTFFSISTSPLYINEGYDSVIFKSVGLAITQGKVPYVDIFDHKGPILYFINALGQWLIPGRLGIFLLQIIATSISFIFLFKIARLFLNGVQSIAVMAATLFVLAGLYQGGNLCEEWILAIASPLLYYLFEDISSGTDKHITPLYGFFYGFSFGLAFYIRPNDALAIIGGALLGAVIYAFVVHKMSIAKLVYCVSSFIAGFIVVTIPIVFYFVYNEAFNEFIYGLFIHNSLYSGGVLGLLFAYKKIALLIIWILLWFLIKETQYKNILFVVIPICAFQFLVMGARVIPHYLIDYICLFLLLGVFLIKIPSTSTVLTYCALLYCVGFIGRLSLLRMSENTIIECVELLVSHDEKCRTFYAESDKLLNIVPQESQDSIWNYNVTWRDEYPSYSSIFFHHNITPCNKLLHYTMCYLSEKLKKEDDIKIFCPPYVVLTHAHDDDTIRQPSWARFAEDYSYIEANYDLLAKTDSTICDIQLYKRK